MTLFKNASDHRQEQVHANVNGLTAETTGKKSREKTDKPATGNGSSGSGDPSNIAAAVEAGIQTAMNAFFNKNGGKQGGKGGKHGGNNWQQNQQGNFRNNPYGNGGKGSGKGKGGFACHKCGQPGHSRANCPNKKKEYGGK